jgi:quercetin dioxygenase-like cupin family protein
MRTARSFSWDDLDVDHPKPLVDRRHIHGENMTVAHVLLHEGLFVDIHSHPNEQIALIMSGKIEFEVGEDGDRKKLTLGAGEILHLPPNVPHSARALEDSLLIDVFSPVAEKTGVDG